MRFLQYSPIASQSAAASYTSSAIDMSQIYKMSAQVVASAGTVTGTVQLQVSDDPVVANNLFADNVFTHWSNLGSAVSVSAAGTTLITQQDMCYRALRAVFTTTVAVSDVVTTVADVGGSLNDSYFTIGNVAGTMFYVWFNVDGGGTDPAIPGMTGVEVAISEDDTADDVATAIDSAFSGVPGFTESVLADDVTLLRDSAGYAVPAEDSEDAPTGFTFVHTAPTSSITVNLFAYGV